MAVCLHFRFSSRKSYLKVGRRMFTHLYMFANSSPKRGCPIIVNRYCQPHSQFPKPFLICADSEHSKSLFLTSQPSLKIFTQKPLFTPVSPEVVSTINDENILILLKFKNFSFSNFCHAPVSTTQKIRSSLLA